MIKFSVVCPVYNSEKFITKTINDVLNQTLLPHELIIVDDGSSDNTINVLNTIFNSYNGLVKLKLILSNHSGPGAARNEGIRACQNEWIAFIDSDDGWEKNKLYEVAKVIELNPFVNIICHNENFVRLNYPPIKLNYSLFFEINKSISFQLYKRNLFSPSATVCHIKLFNELGFFDEDLSSSQDYDLWLKLSPIMQPAFISEILGTYYERNGNISSSKLKKRFVNHTKVLIRHRKKVPMYLFISSFVKSILVYLSFYFKKYKCFIL